MNTTQTPVRITANHTVTKRLGNWTTERAHRDGGFPTVDDPTRTI
jgi:hypothetical protein